MRKFPRSFTNRRSLQQWVVRGGLATLAAAIGWFSVSDTLANVIVKGDGLAAYALAPWDGVIVANLAQAEISDIPISDEKSRPAGLAREAIRLDPTAVEALDVLGLQAQLRGETERAREIFSQSLSLTRRELRPQIWAIEEAVSRGDIVGALHQYDIALRTSRRAPEILFPVLGSAIAKPKIRSNLIAVLETRPAWGKRFIEYLARGQISADAAVSFFLEGEPVGLPIEDIHRTSLVNALANQGQNEEAWNFYSTFRRTERNRSRDPNFESMIEKPAVYDWSPRYSPGISSSVHRGEDRNVFDFSAAPSVGGVVLQQRQALPRGAYVFESTIEDLDQPDRSRPYWTLSCIGGKEMKRISVPNAVESRVKFSGRFQVPSGCDAQILALTIRPSDDISGVSGRVVRAQISPVSEKANWQEF